MKRKMNRKRKETDRNNLLNEKEKINVKLWVTNVRERKWAMFKKKKLNDL